MKLALILLLALSLAGNAVLFIGRGSKAGAGTAVATKDHSSADPARTKGASATGPVATASSDEVKFGQTWARLQTGDLAALAGRLRTEGFPPSVVRAIVAAQVQESFAARRRALFEKQEESEYWKPRLFADMNLKLMAELRQLGREQSDLLKQLVGSGGAEDDERLMFQRRQFGNLPTEKIDQMQTIVADYAELRNQIYSVTNGVMLPEDREKLKLLDQEQHADLASLLTPQELENYELRTSSTAASLRSQLALFKPTEAEFRAIFQLQQAFDQKYGSANTVSSAEQFQQRQARQKELEAQVGTVLDPSRIEAYRQSVDPAYQTVNRLVARLELPPSAATQVVTAQQDFTKRATAIRSNKDLSSEVRNMQLNALAQEATAALTTTLGTRGLEAYKQYGGQWLQNLAPRPTGGTPAP